MIVLKQPGDSRQMGEHKAELRLFYPSELVESEGANSDSQSG